MIVLLVIYRNYKVNFITGKLRICRKVGLLFTMIIPG